MRTLAVVVGVLLWSCRGRREERLDLHSGYPAPIARLLVQRCGGCHGSKAVSASHAHGDYPSPSLNLSRWDSLFYGPSRELAPVVPGQPRWSALLWHLNTDSTWGPVAAPLMPPPLPDSSNRLSRAELELLRQWIAEGALNYLGESPWRHRRASSRRKVFICAAASDLIAVYDADTYHLMAYIPVGIHPTLIESPHYIQISPDGRYLYVTLIAGAAVEVYRTDTYEKVGRLEVAPEPAHIELSGDGTHAVITHFTDGGSVKLTLIQTSPLAILDELRDPLHQIIARPHGLWVAPDFSHAYVTANRGNYIVRLTIGPDRRRFIDFVQIPLQTGALPQPDVRWGPYQILMEPSQRYYFISCEVSHEVRVFSRANDSLVAVIPTGEAPKLMAYHEGLVYVACLKAYAPGLQGERRGAVAVIEVERLKLLTHIYNLGHLPRGIGIDPVKRQLWVSFENIGAVDPPHHPVGGSSELSKVYILQLPTFQLLAVRAFASGGYGLNIVP
ncbi:MAG: YncE family protein [Bacteroidia bacterium]